MIKTIKTVCLGCQILLLLIIIAACSRSKDAKTSSDSEAALLYVTTLDKSKLIQSEVINPCLSCDDEISITLDTTKTYQVMDGFGFTLNGGSAKHLQNMSASPRMNLLQELFGKDSSSISVSYLRLSIGGSDLDEYPWSYDDLPRGETDNQLEKFSLGYDTLYLIPTLREILAISPNIKLMGSPWSPPVWMKNNGDTRGGSLKTEYHDVYASYLVRYIQEMKKVGFNLDAITIQNEPLHPGNNPSLLMLADQQADFVKNSLGPQFEANNLKTKILIYDHNADRPDYPISILDDAEAAKYIDGSAFHLYGGTIDALSEVHEAHPDKSLYFTEQWIGAPGNFAGDFSWHIENLVIGAPRNWAKTVLEWNLAADQNQGPHTDRGGCESCLGALTITGDAISRNPAYYIIAQVAKFVPSGSVRVGSNTTDNILNVAFKTPDGQLVIILQNKNASESKVNVQAKGVSYQVSLETGAVGTLVIKF